MNDQQNVINFLKTYHPSTPATYKIATSLLGGLRQRSLMELYSVAESRYIQYRIRKILKAPSEPQRNTPIANLLSLYIDKKSGKVVSAREELLRRLPYLDASVQVQVVEAFLNGSPTDVGAMSKYLMGHWDEMYQSMVKKAWLSSPCNDSLAKLVIRYFPLDYVIEHMSELKEYDGPMLATRRCQAGEKPRIEEWPLTDYLAIIYNSGMSMAEEEAIYLMKSYLVSAAIHDIKHGRIPDYTRQHGIHHPSLIYLEGVRLMLYYLGGMGFTKALALFETMDDEICDIINDSGYIDYIEKNGQISYEDKISRIWLTFCKAIDGWYSGPELMKMRVKENTDATPSIPYDSEYNYLVESSPNFQKVLNMWECYIDENGQAKLPNRLLRIIECSFCNCMTLASIVIPESVRVIGDAAFKGCTGLTSIEIPESVKDIGIRSFTGCTRLSSIVVSPDNPNFKSVNNCCFSKDGKTLYFGCKNSVIPDSVTKIETSAFEQCKELKSIIIPGSVQEIGDMAFHGSTGLNNLHIQNGVKIIGCRAFEGCTGLSSIEIPGSVQEIGDAAFYICEGLTNVHFQNGVKAIGFMAFAYCKSMVSIEIPESLTELGYCAFQGCTSLSHIIVSSGNPAFKSESNCCLSKDGKTLYFGCNESNIPDGVTKISSHAFEGYKMLANIRFPDGVTTIKDYAFYGCSGLLRIDIPDSITVIENRAFEGCDNLADVILHINNVNFAESVGIIDNILKIFGDGKVTLCIPSDSDYSPLRYPFNGMLKKVVFE